MVHCKFPGRNAPLPTFRRKFRETVDRKHEAELIALAQNAGVKVGKDWAHERLAIPKPGKKEETLVSSLDAFGEGMNEGIGETV